MAVSITSISPGFCRRCARRCFRKPVNSGFPRREAGECPRRFDAPFKRMPSIHRMISKGVRDVVTARFQLQGN
jgi:hypothetical protein